MPDQMPGTRLWMYTNFDCNLACDYCCVRSSPTQRRALGADRVRRLAEEAVDAGVSELILTGGEPFLLPDLDDLVATCTAALPTTLLTNAMLFRGRRLQMLRRMDRDRVVLQISLDSPTPHRHDQHRGARSWERAVAGIRTAQAEGFRFGSPPRWSRNGSPNSDRSARSSTDSGSPTTTRSSAPWHTGASPTPVSNSPSSP